MPAVASKPVDLFNRPLRDLRISVTDRCNFRCIYCMPKALFGSDHVFLSRSRILSFEEIQRVVSIVSKLGVSKIRITGGEPLVRKDLATLIGKISSVKGITDISLTTNGALLSRNKALDLKNAGLSRITVSLDAIDDQRFKQINDVQFPVKRVLDAIDNARAVGLDPIKVNMVVMKGINDDQILPMADYFHNRRIILRFIEFMDVGNTNNWQMDKVVSAEQIISKINRYYPIEPILANYHGEVAKRWRYQDGTGEIGMIASVSQPFCGGCHRARLSAEGKLYTCLFADSGYDLRTILRAENDDKLISAKLTKLWQKRDDRYSQLRGQISPGNQKVEMSHIGG